jgi:hypothetical protein
MIFYFTAFYRNTVALTLGSFAALGNAQQPLPSKDTDKPQQIICLCGETHRFFDCPYINPAKRSSGWKANSDTTKKFDTCDGLGP